MATPFITTGVPTTPGSNGSVPVRREIRDLQKNNPQQWNLFLLGIRALQTMDENDQLSWYQIAGIHGAPYEAWNGVNGIDGQKTGYCTHSSILFLPWHRPYLALFEQLLSNKMKEIANTFPDFLRSQYVSAAQDFRLPYWDWGLLPATGQNAFPSSIAGAQIQVTGTDGKPQTIPNPLERYNFNLDNLNSGAFPDAPYNTWATTHRYPRDDSPNTSSQDWLVNSAINSQVRSIRSQLRYAMNSISEFAPFSNNKWTPGAPGTYPSLEDIHDNIHVLCGGPSPNNQTAPAGNMSVIPYAAFDPVFWLHHCNVDRLFAIWQALHPDSYVVPEITADGTFTESPDSTEDANSDLTPFWLDNSTFHTAESAKSTPSFGYAYPETQSWNFANQALYQQSIRVAIKKLYGSTVLASSTNTVATFGPRRLSEGIDLPVRRREAKVQESSRDPLTTHSGGFASRNDKHGMKSEKIASLSKSTDELGHANGRVKSLVHREGKICTDRVDDCTSHAIADHNYTEWVLNILVKKHGLGGPFQVHIFNGNVPVNTAEWLIHDNNVGTCSVLGSNPATTSCEKCKADANRDLTVTGTILLTETLLEAIRQGNLRSLEVVDVVPYLKKMLHWRVTQSDGTETPREEVPGLKVSVVSTNVVESTDPDQLPIYSGEYTIHPECTQGKPGGYNNGDQY